MEIDLIAISCKNIKTKYRKKSIYIYIKQLFRTDVLFKIQLILAYSIACVLLKTLIFI